MAKKNETTYTERPLADALADPKHIAEVENRQPDQIADYHQKNPTLKAGKAQAAEPPTSTPE